MVADPPITVACSIGMAISLTGYADPEDLVRDAQKALMRARSEGPVVVLEIPPFPEVFRSYSAFVWRVLLRLGVAESERPTDRDGGAGEGRSSASSPIRRSTRSTSREATSTCTRG